MMQRGCSDALPNGRRPTGALLELSGRRAGEARFAEEVALGAIDADVHDLDQGILVGVILSMGLFIYRTMRPRFAKVGRFHDGTFRDLKIHPELRTCPNIVIIRFDMSLYYANAGYFETKMLQVFADHPNAKYIILDAEGINMLDSTGEMVLTQLRDRLDAAGVKFIVARMKRLVATCTTK